jgi:hypothetical protein
VALAVVSASAPTAAQQDVLTGFMLGKVYEVDKEAYRRYVERMRASRPDFDEKLQDLDFEQFLEERDDTTVTARVLASNAKFASEQTSSSGDYTIRDTPVGTYDFSLLYEGREYPVQQHLDLNVELSYVAELCFVIDPEEQVAWMVTDGVRRAEEVPPWVPRQCVSSLTACLAMLIGADGGYPDGLLLLLAGGGAAAAAFGIISPTDQVEASPVRAPR